MKTLYTKYLIGAVLAGCAAAMCVSTMSAQEAADSVAVVEPVAEAAAEAVGTVAAVADEASADVPGADWGRGIDTVWMLLAAMLVFFMQPGFAMVEAGFTRVKNTTNILMKNFVDFTLGSLLRTYVRRWRVCRNATLLRLHFLRPEWPA